MDHRQHGHVKAIICPPMHDETACCCADARCQSGGITAHPSFPAAPHDAAFGDAWYSSHRSADCQRLPSRRRALTPHRHPLRIHRYSEQHELTHDCGRSFPYCVKNACATRADLWCNSAQELLYRFRCAAVLSWSSGWVVSTGLCSCRGALCWSWQARQGIFGEALHADVPYATSSCMADLTAGNMQHEVHDPACITDCAGRIIFRTERATWWTARCLCVMRIGCHSHSARLGVLTMGLAAVTTRRCAIHSSGRCLRRERRLRQLPLPFRTPQPVSARADRPQGSTMDSRASRDRTAMQAVPVTQTTPSSCSMGRSGDHRLYKRRLPAVSATMKRPDCKSWRTVSSTACTTPSRRTSAQHGALPALRARLCWLQTRSAQFVPAGCWATESKVQLSFHVCVPYDCMLS